MKNRYLIISDLHLSDIEDNIDGWKSYKASRFLFDEELENLVKRFVSEGRGLELTLVLNGDVFDFDLVTAVPAAPPWPVSEIERGRCLNPTGAKSAFKLKRIISDHPVFIRTLAEFLLAGHKIVYVLGNHDREIHFSEVRDVLTGAVSQVMEARGGKFESGSMTFEPWFYYVPGEIYAEHGNQYDYYSSFRYVLSPVVRVNKEEAIALPMGNLSNRYLMTRMGFFNPFASDFILNIFRYIRHWFVYYAFSRRSLFLNWLWGSMLVMGELLAEKKRLLMPPLDYGAKLQEASKRSGLARETLSRLNRLQPMPITYRFYKILREFWIDRLALSLVFILGTIALALSPIPLWIKLMVPLTSFPLLYFIYEWLVRDDSIFTVDKEVPMYARRVAEILPVKAVLFGHTHRPCQIPLMPGVVFINTGTWAPITDQERPELLAQGLKNYAIITPLDDGTGRIDVEFNSWA